MRLVPVKEEERRQTKLLFRLAAGAWVVAAVVWGIGLGELILGAAFVVLALLSLAYTIVLAR